MSADGRAEESPQQGIQSIEVGAQVLRALEAGRGPVALSEVARNCAMHLARVHRYLVSLVRASLASQDAHRPVRPGAGIASSLHRMIYGMATFGAPVFGPDRGLVLAIGLAMPARPMAEGHGARPTGW